MATDYDSCRQKLEELRQWFTREFVRRNEATTRLHLIDTLLFDCLGWDKRDVKAEDPHGGEYTDYSFTTTRRVLLVEAKNQGDYFEAPAGRRPQYKIRGLRKNHPNLKKALDQLMGYCQKRGVPYGVVTNGHQIVAVLASRDDGVPPGEGSALVFGSFDAMAERFTELWNALSKDGVEENQLKTMLLGSRTPAIPPKLSSLVDGYPGVKDRNIFQTDLQIVGDLVMEDVTKSPDIESTFLQDCYCQSGALSQHSLLSKHILEARYSALFEPADPASPVKTPTTEPAIGSSGLAESLSRRPILLLGDAGVGKSIFTRYLMRVDASEVFKNAITLYLDLGTRATLSDSLKSFIVQELERQLLEFHDIDLTERQFVRGVYNLDIKRFGKSYYGDLRESAPDAYREKELKFLETLVEQREEHLRRCLEHVESARLKQIVVFLDNIDQREHALQEEAFLIAEELGERWPVTVFLALRPETFNRSVRAGALSGYHPKAFTIHPPRIERVIERRLEFGLRLTRGEIPIQSLGRTADKSLVNLEAILEVLLASLKQNQSLVECIDNMASGNVRLALDLVKCFLGSGHVDTKKIVEVFQRTGRYTIPLHEFLRAVIYGDAEHYNPRESPITNMFDVTSEDPRGHFLLPVLLGVLKTLCAGDTQEGFVEPRKIYEEVQQSSFLPEEIDRAMVRAHANRLVEMQGRAAPLLTDDCLLGCRITAHGAYHVLRLCYTFVYFDAVCVDTPIFDEDVRTSIKDAHRIRARLKRCATFLDYLDGVWRSALLTPKYFDWPGAAAAVRQDIADVEERLTAR